MKTKIKLSDVLLPAVAFVVIILIWQYATKWFNVPSYILPSPAEILRNYYTSGPELWKNFFITFLESFLGMLLGSMVGFLIGVSMAQSTVFQKISLPFLIASNAIPIIAIAPIIIIWFGNTMIAKIMVAAFIAFFPIVLNTYRGLSEYRRYFRELFKIYGASETQFLFKYKLGNALPYIITGLKLNATLSVIGAIVAEFVSSDRGLGFGILQASYNFDSAKLWGYIFLACLIGVGFYTIIYIFEQLFLHKFKNN